MPSELISFMHACLDDEAALAQAASPGPWNINAESDEVLAVDGIAVADGFALSGRQLRATTEHIARHDPARALREIEVKRQTLADLAAAEERMDRASRDQDTAGYNAARAEWTVLKRIVRRGAAVYADRPGYREEWRP
ncbi:DUF6221 family protein [Streptomyces antimycoticus]|uniref:DUF6221 family protein n=1 Tax=Streptomyces antimycoticus TaxID=68175 RepID=UPI0036C72927